MELTVDLIGTGLGGDVDVGAHGEAGGGVEGAGLDLELGNGGLGRRVGHAGGGAVGVDVDDAIDGEVVVVVAGAVSAELAGGGVERGFAEAEVGAVDGAGGKVDEVHGVAGEEGEFFDAPLVNDLAEGDIGGVEEWGFGSHFDGLGDLADLEFEIEGDEFGGADLDTGTEEFREARGFGLDAIGAGIQVGGAIVACVAGGGGGC